ncbi:MAG TPA: hypothetical protein EYN06_02440 [Myxococcales bacterium]|nr:hypothetical protein [Myxococcales bacterium]HIN85311.1 hypothetical protein [Myxococcales bacterium]
MNIQVKAMLSPWTWGACTVVAVAVMYLLLEAAVVEKTVNTPAVADLSSVLNSLTNRSENPAKQVAALHHVSASLRPGQLLQCDNQSWAQTSERMRESAGRSMQEKNTTAAQAELRRLLALKTPDSCESANWLRRDALFALATLALASGNMQSSRAAIEKALSLDAQEDLLRANLLALRSLASRIQGGKTSGEADRLAAVSIYQTAIKGHVQ